MGGIWAGFSANASVVHFEGAFSVLAKAAFVVVVETGVFIGVAVGMAPKAVADPYGVLGAAAEGAVDPNVGLNEKELPGIAVDDEAAPNIEGAVGVLLGAPNENEDVGAAGVCAAEYPPKEGNVAAFPPGFPKLNKPELPEGACEDEAAPPPKDGIDAELLPTEDWGAEAFD